MASPTLGLLMFPESRLPLLTSEDCRRRASDCVDAAFNEASSDTRLAYISLAAHWFKLAEEARMDENADMTAIAETTDTVVH
jgi:hypothetical protein